MTVSGTRQVKYNTEYYTRKEKKIECLVGVAPNQSRVTNTSFTRIPQDGSFDQPSVELVILALWLPWWLPCAIMQGLCRNVPNAQENSAFALRSKMFRLKITTNTTVNSRLLETEHPERQNEPVLCMRPSHSPAVFVFNTFTFASSPPDDLAVLPSIYIPD